MIPAGVRNNRVELRCKVMGIGDRFMNDPRKENARKVVAYFNACKCRLEAEGASPSGRCPLLHRVQNDPQRSSRVAYFIRMSFLEEPNARSPADENASSLYT